MVRLADLELETGLMGYPKTGRGPREAERDRSGRKRIEGIRLGGGTGYWLHEESLKGRADGRVNH